MHLAAMSRATHRTEHRFPSALTGGGLLLAWLLAACGPRVVAAAGPLSSAELLQSMQASERADLLAISELTGATLGEPLPILGWPELAPTYTLRTLLAPSGEVLGVVSESPEDGRWLWYTFGCRGLYPAVSSDAALEKARRRASALGLSGGVWDAPAAVRMPDRRLYWVCAPRDGPRFFIDMDLAGEPARCELDGTDQACMSAPSGAPRCAPPPGYVAPPPAPRERPLPLVHDIAALPFHFQQTSWCCGCASVHMLMDFFGPEVNQPDIGDVENENSEYGTYAVDNRRACHFSGLSTAIQNPDLQGYVERQLGYAGNDEYLYNDPKRLLKQAVASNEPVEILTCFDTSCDSGHFRVVKGYDDGLNEFIVHDPWYAPPYWGPELHFNQDVLAYDMWLPWSSGWALTSGPWEIRFSAPSQVAPGEVFDLHAGIRYPGRGPFSGEYPAAGAFARIQLPSGFSLASGGTDVPLPSMASGDSAAVSWRVVASSTAGPYELGVRARGTISGFSHSYPSYQDSIGGGGLHALSVGSPDPSSWEEEQRLTVDPAGSNLAYTNGRVVFVQEDGTVHLVWSDTRDGNGEIYYRMRTASWGPEVRLTDEPALSEHPVITGTPGGDLHVAWVDSRSGVKDIYYKSCSGGVWSPDLRVSQAAVQEINPSIAIDGAGRVHLAWVRVWANTTKVAYSVQENGTWSNPTDVGGVAGRSADMPSLAALSDGTVFLFYEQDLAGRVPGDILYRIRLAGVWQTVVELTTASSYSRTPSACAGSDGRVHVAWYDGRDGSGDIYYMVWEGGSWGPETLVQGGAEDSEFPSIAAGPLGQVEVAWQEFRDGNAEIYHRLYSGAWHPAERLTRAPLPSVMPNMAIDGAGNGSLVWSDLRDGNPEIYYRRRVAESSGVPGSPGAPGGPGAPNASDGTGRFGGAAVLSLSITPSPAAGRVVLLYSFPASAAGGEIRIGVYDVAGRQVRGFAQDECVRGQGSLAWDGRDDAGRSIQAGCYVIRMRSGGVSVSHPLIWLGPK